METINIYEKIQTIKVELLKANLKKSGENKFSGFKYYELADFVPTVEELCLKYKLFTKIYFTIQNAYLDIVNCETPTEREVYTSPMKEIDMKGNNAIQSLGGVETYQRRYLYMAAFDITENDTFDKVSGKEVEVKKITKQQIETLKELVEDIDALCKYYKIDKLEDLDEKEALSVINRKTS